MNGSVKGAFAGAALMLGAMSTVQAQATPATASIPAQAVVQTALTASTVQGLDFGSTFGGIARTVLPADVTSGEVGFGGGANSEITITFTSLPATLTGPGTAIPLTYGSNSAATNPAGTRAGSTTFDPAVARTVRLNATTGLLSLYLGGTRAATAETAHAVHAGEGADGENESVSSR